MLKSVFYNIDSCGRYYKCFTILKVRFSFKHTLPYANYVRKVITNIIYAS